MNSMHTINTEIANVLNNIVEAGFGEHPIPYWEKTNNFDLLKKQYHIPGIGIACVQDFYIDCVRHYGIRTNNL